MLKVYLGAILMVLGMFAIMAQPIVGVIMIGGGYYLFQKSSAIQRHDATSTFFGFCILAGGVVALVELIAWIVH